MYAIVKASKVVQLISSPKPVVINDVGHPKEIFISWTKAEKKKIGIYDFIPSSPIDTRFETGGAVSYTVNDTKGTVTETITKKNKALEDVKEVDEKGKAILDIDGNQVVTKGLKTIYIEQIKKTAKGLLSPTDWMVWRYVEDNKKTIPSAVSTFRSNVRTKADEICTAIDGCSSLTKFKELFQNIYKKDGSIDVIAKMNDFPSNKDVKEYER